ncbi:hypothetical protein DP893_23750 [Escherichia coli O8]|nr:hypothetical protein [Escherichia coli O8]
MYIKYLKYYIYSHNYSFRGYDVNKFYKVIWNNMLQNWIVVGV